MENEEKLTLILDEINERKKTDLNRYADKVEMKERILDLLMAAGIFVIALMFVFVFFVGINTLLG